VRRRRGALALEACGAIGVAGLAVTVWLGLWVTPPDRFMGNLVRLLYIHPPVAWVMYLAYGLSFLASILYLWPRTRDVRFDRLAGSAAEVGVLFTGLTLISGSIWGRPTWGHWWTWDPLLTTTALLFVLYLGYLALRRVPGEPSVRARRSAIGALVAFVDVPIVYFSVEWWRSLHQEPTVTVGRTYVHGSMAWTLLLGFLSMTALFVWMVGHRYRLAGLLDDEEGSAVAAAVAERRAEVTDRTGGAGDRAVSGAGRPAGSGAAGSAAPASGAEGEPAAAPGAGGTGPAPVRADAGLAGSRGR
jgi:heme exporter protein C